jgi:hypothetical protein
MDVEEVINTQTYTILTMETTKNISKNSIGDHLYKKNSYRVKEVCKYFLMATLNIVFSFLRIVKLCGKRPKILIPA